jgi:hypothetical protein
MYVSRILEDVFLENDNAKQKGTITEAQLKQKVNEKIQTFKEQHPEPPAYIGSSSSSAARAPAPRPPTPAPHPTDHRLWTTLQISAEDHDLITYTIDDQSRVRGLMGYDSDNHHHWVNTCTANWGYGGKGHDMYVFNMYDRFLHGPADNMFLPIQNEIEKKLIVQDRYIMSAPVVPTGTAKGKKKRGKTGKRSAHPKPLSDASNLRLLSVNMCCDVFKPATVIT